MLRTVGLPDESNFPPEEERAALEDCRTIGNAVAIIGENCRAAEEELRKRFPLPWVSVHFSVFFTSGKTRAHYGVTIGEDNATGDDVSMAVSQAIELYEHRQRITESVA